MQFQTAFAMPASFAFHAESQVQDQSTSLVIDLGFVTVGTQRGGLFVHGLRRLDHSSQRTLPPV